MDIYQYAGSLWGQAEIPPQSEQSLSQFHQKIADLFPPEIPKFQRKICIFCAGDYGERLYWSLRERLVVVDFFSDNSPGKWGYMMDRVSCIPRQTLKTYKDCTAVIVANRSPAAIVEDLRADGYPAVLAMQELEPALRAAPPVKWVSQWQALDALDYSTPGAQILIQKFSDTIFDLCAYYHDRCGHA